ncbi:MAG: nucleoside triphosphate pyrophosphohydrolase [Bacteroidetes bacterium HGW-Bacteroidetes-6]|jgi:XTP/dITP diphosphohydrolase|nr:MAG: nucleoside triphosphate pyrophosphohydrolase [Bacteroidetes bacterium HGW-Bacteroidetes-6]
MNKKLAEFERLLNIMDRLRLECPWDQKQTNETLRYLTIEEMYELGDAVLEKDDDGIMKELGDLMLHIVFYAKIGEEKNAFNMGDVLASINEKLIRRHPHVFGETTVTGEDDVKANWEKIKMGEGRKSVLEGVPAGLPAMVKAFRIQEKVKGVGFEWEETDQVWDKVKEELNELESEVSSNSTMDKIEDEFGDVLFSLVNYARFIGVNPENALERTNKKFIQRFKFIEESAAAMGKSLNDMSLAEMDAIWVKAKKH